jgi:hypothetical protein
METVRSTEKLRSEGSAHNSTDSLLLSLDEVAERMELSLLRERPSLKQWSIVLHHLAAAQRHANILWQQKEKQRLDWITRGKSVAATNEEKRRHKAESQRSARLKQSYKYAEGLS